MEDDQKKSGLVAVVVTYNRLLKLQMVIDRLLKEPAQDLDAVLVIDNASNDGTFEWLAQQSDARLFVERQQKNLGGAGGFARGIELAREWFDPDWVVLMDDDAAPKQKAFRKFHQLDLKCHDGRYDIIASAVYTPQGAICHMNRPKRNPFWHKRFFIKKVLLEQCIPSHIEDSAYETDGHTQGKHSGTIIDVDCASFVGLFLSRHALDIGGLPDADLFIYSDDVIYTLGLVRQGCGLGFAPSIMFEHDSETAQGTAKAALPMWKVYYYYRNLLRLYRDAAGMIFWWFLPVWFVKWAFLVFYYPKGSRAMFLYIFSCAFFDGLRKKGGFSFDEVKTLCDDADILKLACGAQKNV